ncbi:MAG TPA: GAF domain-containing protein [Solirubrobacteraceae bacterium]|nr:GAF domain-containing protein [Solirubrobacteraceae bacterium]
MFGFAPSILLARDAGADRLFAVAGNGYDRPAAGAEVRLGEGVIGTAAQSGQVVCVANLARSRIMQSAVRAALASRGAPVANEIPLPGLPVPASVAAVPLAAQGEVTGVLYLESERAGHFGPHNERLLRVIGRHLALALAGLAREEGDPGAGAAAPPTASAPSDVAEDRAPVCVSYYQADDSVFVGDRYVVKGAPGRILWKLLREHADAGRAEFTNRELRLDESLGLPAGADNLEARLLVLRKRLATDEVPIALERVGRGRLELGVAGPLQLVEVPTGGVMSAAHAARER